MCLSPSTRQDDTLVAKKSSARFAINADDWKPFNKNVYKVVKDLHAKGFKIVVFRRAPRTAVALCCCLAVLRALSTVTGNAPGCAATRRASARRLRASSRGTCGSAQRTSLPGCASRWLRAAAWRHGWQRHLAGAALRAANALALLCMLRFHTCLVMLASAPLCLPHPPAVCSQRHSQVLTSYLCDADGLGGCHGADGHARGRLPQAQHGNVALLRGRAQRRRGARCSSQHMLAPARSLAVTQAARDAVEAGVRACVRRLTCM